MAAGINPAITFTTTRFLFASIGQSNGH